MVQSTVKKPNALHELGYKIFLDRYAQKDMTRATLAVGDTVIVVVDSKTGQREVGTVTAIDLPKVTVRLNDGQIVERDLENVDKPLETQPEQMMDRVAAGIAEIERSDELRKTWTKNFRWLLDDWKFVPGGRILTGAGTDQKLTYYNCYVIPSPKDSRSGIITTLEQMTEIMSRGGGVGINISSLRPRHAYVKGVNGRSSGAVSWGALYSFVTGLIEQGGCFGPNERILTSEGLIPARELAERMEAGETFWAHTHRGLRRITARFRNGRKPLYEVVTRRGHRVEITEDHKVAVLMDGQVTTMPLKYLQVGDEILTLLGDGVQKPYVQLKAVAYERSIMSTTLNETVTLPTVLDEDLAYLLGYLHADGQVVMGHKVTWQAPKGFKLATADDHPAIRERLKGIIQRLFGVEPVERQGDGACVNLAVYSRVVVEWLKANGFLKAHAEDVTVPEAIFRSPSSVMGSFFAGYFDADGCNRGKKGGAGIDSVSLPMLQGLQMLLSINGIASHISTQDRTAQGWRSIHCLTVTGANFKARLAAFAPAEKLADAGHGTRDMYNTYPYAAHTTLGARSKYRQRIHNGVSERVSFDQLSAIRERLVAHREMALADEVRALQHVLPDTIVRITPLAEDETFDFEVDDVHLLSANGIYTSNSRRGALMLILNDWHPDVFNFINSKREAGNITNANISVGISDRFMEAVKADADWDLMFPDTSAPDYDETWDGDLEAWQAKGGKVIHYKTIKARELWNAIIESAWASAEPGVWFRERSNKMSNSWYFSPLISTNPCGEQPLSAWSVCNLGAINLAKFYDPATNDVAWDTLDRTVRYAVRFLDNVIDSTPYFFEENERKQGSERRVGLGTMGVAELMLYCGVRYGSDESVAFIEKLYKAIAIAAYETSADLAAEKGAFEAFDADKVLQSGFMQQMPEDVRQRVKAKGLRNVTLLTQAPTGTTGTMVNTSTGIEPFFSWVYYRKSRLGLHEEQVPVVADWYAKNPGAEKLPDYFVTAMDLSPEEHVKVQGAFQRWIDSAISKTCNVPNHYSVEQVSQLYLQMYDLGCKGGTIYRDGSRSEQVLMLKGDERAEKEMEGLRKEEKPAPEPVQTPHKEYPRPVRLTGTTVKFRTPFGTSYITMNNDEHGNPFEVFITVGKAGSDIQADAEAMGRMISLQLRTTAPQNRREMLRLLMEQLQGIGGARPTGIGSNRVLSLPDAVANAIAEYYFKEDAPQQLGLPMAGVEPVAPVQSRQTNGGYGGGSANVTLSPKEVMGFKSGADMCPECGTISLIRAEGCRRCTTCDYTEC